MKTTYIGTRPREVYSIDLIPDVTPKSTYGNNQIVVLVDNFSKYVVLGAVPDRKSETLAKWFYRSVVGYFGVPAVIKSDNGLEFTASFERMCEDLSVKHW